VPELQQLVRKYTQKWCAQGTWGRPNLSEALMWMATEVGEALDACLSLDPKWTRNNPKPAPTNEEIAEEVFDAILMGCLALDSLGVDLMEVAQRKLFKMDERRKHDNETGRKA